MNIDNKLKLLSLFKQRAFSFGDFTLSSGQKSNYYIDSKKAIFNSYILNSLTSFLYDEIKEFDFDCIGGMETGAIPLTVMMFSMLNHPNYEGFYIRKTPKPHGSGNLIEGNIKPGMKAIILEDVVSTAGSVMKAISEVEKVGVSVINVTCIVDRLMGGREIIEQKCSFRSIFTIKDFGIE